VFSKAKETSENQQFGRIERSAVSRRERVQMEGPAQRIWELACNLRPGEPLGEEGCAARGVCAFAATENHTNPSECCEPGFHLY